MLMRLTPNCERSARLGWTPCSPKMTFTGRSTEAAALRLLPEGTGLFYMKLLGAETPPGIGVLTVTW